jgi:protein-S-isoprenylcysteine O-methyltransferase Ste14
MLDYEKRLHLDKNWEKMQAGYPGKHVVSVMVGAVCFIAVYIALKWLLSFLPDPAPWNVSPLWKQIYGISFLRVDILYFALGLLTYSYGCVRFYGINRQNHSVRGKGDTPDSLLTDGYYAKARHPMYGVFIIRSAAVLLSLRSMIGVIVAVLFAALQYANARREEQRVLIPLFGEAYRSYAAQTRRMLLRKAEAVALILFTLVSIAGLFPI